MVGQKIKENPLKKEIAWLLAILFTFSFLAGCGKMPRSKRTATGNIYTVKKGDTLWEIAQKFEVPVQELAEWNNILDPDGLMPGQEIHVRRSRNNDPTHREKADAVYRTKIDFFREKFIWPVDGVVFSSFGVRKGRRHDGIDISAPSGTPVKAAAAGDVVFNKQLRGYGNIVILRHPDHYYTAYAHNRKNLVRMNQKVKQGDVISEVGRTGRASGPHLHFEIRRGQEARNPLFYLPIQNERQEKLVEKAMNGDRAATTMGSSKKRTRSKKRSASSKKSQGIVKYHKTTSGQKKSHKIIKK